MNLQALTEAERMTLLTLARATITRATRHEASVPPPAAECTARLQAPGAAFVTLHTRAGDLRGCIGTIEAHRPLIEDVQENALAAAFHDPRFPPVTAKELAQIVIEVSVLTAPELLEFADPEDLLRKLRPNVDGVIIERGWNRATFLPQVWEQLPAPAEFLAHLCQKARLPHNAWRWPDFKVFIYQVEHFSEQNTIK